MKKIILLLIMFFCCGCTADTLQYVGENTEITVQSKASMAVEDLKTTITDGGWTCICSTDADITVEKIIEMIPEA